MGRAEGPSCCVYSLYPSGSAVRANKLQTNGAGLNPEIPLLLNLESSFIKLCKKSFDTMGSFWSILHEKTRFVDLLRILEVNELIKLNRCVGIFLCSFNISPGGHFPGT